MKRILNILSILLVLSFSAQAQLDRSKIPAAGPATKLNFGKSTKFQLKNGLKVIVVENNQLPTISYNLILDIDPIFEDEKAGYTSITGSLLRAGTIKQNKTELDERIDFIGASISTSASGIYANGLKKHNEEILNIMSDILYNPSFPKDELEKEKQQRLSSIISNKNEMQSIEHNIVNSLLYGKKSAYGQIVTEKTLANIQISDCRNYYETYFRPNVAYLIIIGDTNVKEAKKIAKKHFGNWEEKEVPKHDFIYPQEKNKPTFAIANKDASTQAIISVNHTVKLDYKSNDRVAATVMNQILGGGFSSRLFSNLREDKAWTYGAYSSLKPDFYLGSFKASANVKVSVADSALTEISKEMIKIQTELVDNETLTIIKNSMAGSFGRSLESPGTLAQFAFLIDKYNLPLDYFETYMKKLDAVTSEDIINVANKYLNPQNATYVAVGDTNIIRELMKKIAQDQDVKEYNYYGDEI